MCFVYVMQVFLWCIDGRLCAATRIRFVLMVWLVDDDVSPAYGEANVGEVGPGEVGAGEVGVSYVGGA